jgi:hypothetical protein
MGSPIGVRRMCHNGFFSVRLNGVYDRERDPTLCVFAWPARSFGVLWGIVPPFGFCWEFCCFLLVRWDNCV